MTIAFWAATDQGQQREHNEDNYLVDKNLNLFVVADGMGGHAAGEVASSLCVRRVRDAVSENRDIIKKYDEGGGADRKDVLRVLEHAVQAACSAIYERAQQQPEKRGMGTTCSLLLLAGDRGFIAHVGDSRVYLMRQSQIHQLSEDHSLINELARRGKLDPKDIDKSPYKNFKNAVTRAVGVYESVEVDTLDFDVLPGDRFLLCSDGLHHYFESDETISGILREADAKDATQRFVDLANDGGGHDNITSVVVQVGESEEESQRAQEVTLKLEVLRKMPIFRYLDYKELVRVMNITQVRDYNDNESVVRENDPGDELYIILDGKIRLHKDEAFITYLQRGDHFGEMALVESAPRSASGTAEGPARMLVIRRNEFYEIIRLRTQLSVKILWSLVQVLARRLRKTTEDLSDARLEAALPDMTDDLLFEGLPTDPSLMLSTLTGQSREEAEDEDEPTSD